MVATVRILQVIPFFARSMGRPRVATRGPSREVVMASDICILPTHDNEIMMNIVPIKMYEYVAAGEPVVATSLPGLMKEFGTTNGVLCINRPEDALSVASGLSEDRRMADEGRKAWMFVEKPE